MLVVTMMKLIVVITLTKVVKVMMVMVAGLYLECESFEDFRVET